ncbi:MAG: DUF4956 domain-containing protein [Planctomycetota bacterium]|nr:MAG: DUF4956 domain-containing protein [Planctomycetota bacterium]
MDMNMPTWLSAPFVSDADLDTSVAIVRLITALLFGCLVAGVYRITRGKEDSQGPLLATLVLLTVLLCLTTIVIGNNVARAFGIVGALSIVRFRTVVEDTRDTAFVIFAVGIGMAIGAGYFLVPLVAIPITMVAALLFQPSRENGTRKTKGDSKNGKSKDTRFTLTLRVERGFLGIDSIEQLVAQHASDVALEGIATARNGTALDHTYRLTLETDAATSALFGALNLIDGLQGVELTRG